MNDNQRNNLLMGIIFLFLAIFAGFLAFEFLLKQPKQDFAVPEVNPTAGLGAEGALCGGDKRLPCLPGNTCEITNEETNEGVCVHVTDDPGPAMPPNQ